MNIFSTSNKIHSDPAALNQISLLRQELKSLKFQMGQQQSLVSQSASSVAEAEFRCFSQWGEDGIIQFIINRLPGLPKSFVEFGVENFTEANCRFLLMNNYWKGLVIDGSAEHINYIKADEIYWRYQLRAIKSFVTKENINSVLGDSGFTNEIGILSIDVDGNDYWIWKEISVVKPWVVIVEYNSLFGRMRPITIPYSPNFVRTNAHHSNLYYGASAKALEAIGFEKSYSLIGSNKAGNNLFFIRSDKAAAFDIQAAEDAWTESCFRESRAADTRLTFANPSDAINLIKGMPVVNVLSGDDEVI